MAKLHLDSLLGKRSPKAVRIALDKLPTGTDAYDSAYDSAIERIESQMAEQTELAKQALAFLTCAQSPLSTLELQEAMGVEVGELELDPDNYPDIEDVLASCLGLITVDEDSDIIRLVHYTTQEYLERTLSRWYPEAEAMIVDVCLSYLCLNRYAGPTYWDPTMDDTWYAYAAEHWAHHARRAPSSLERVVDFLTREIPLIRSYTPRRLSVLRFGIGDIKEPWTTGLHFAAEYDLEDALVALLQRGLDLSQRDVHGQTPLLVAARMGSKATVEQLLRHGSSIDERIDEGHGEHAGYTALHLASMNGHVPIVRLLLTAGAAINSQGCNDHETPVSCAVNWGHTEVVQVLLDAKADMALHTLGTLLGRAIWVSDINMTRIILTAGADPNLPAADFGEPPLMEVCYGRRRDSIPIIKMLLDAGANINYIRSNGWTVYGIAKRQSDPHVAEYLLERGADPELGLNGRTDSPHSKGIRLRRNKTERVIPCS